MLYFKMYGLFFNKCVFYEGLNCNIDRKKDSYDNIYGILTYSLTCRGTRMVANLVFVIALIEYSLRYGNTGIVANL